MISSSEARCPQVSIAFLRIAAIRAKTFMVSDARGGLGGTSGWRVTATSQASAMLTGGLAKLTMVTKSASRHLYQVQNPDAMNAADSH
jgi:hypothetical protein